MYLGSNEFWGQVGNGQQDHQNWGRADDLDDNPRPCYKLDTSKPGSDLVGEVVAALSASAVAFKNTNSVYSNELLTHAKQLYTFANQYRGKYSDSISDAANFYRSSGYIDELSWAAAWLYKATGTLQYLVEAESHFALMPLFAGEFSWDDKSRGVLILLSNMATTSNFNYKSNAKVFCDSMVSKASTSAGMVFINEWGSTRHAANVAYVCMVLSKYRSEWNYNTFGRKQIHTLLGDAGRSYVIGFGTNPPTQPHHRESSCPNRPASCGWNEFNSPSANPQILYGGLVGGPISLGGNYEDKRSNYMTNEVAVDYNAGYQSALAALLSMQASGVCV